jgi:hypothetical protein
VYRSVDNFVYCFVLWINTPYHSVCYYIYTFYYTNKYTIQSINCIFPLYSQLVLYYLELKWTFTLFSQKIIKNWTFIILRTLNWNEHSLKWTFIFFQQNNNKKIVFSKILIAYENFGGPPRQEILSEVILMDVSDQLPNLR